QLVDVRVLEQIGRGLVEIRLEGYHVLLQHAEGVESAVVSQRRGLRNPPLQAFQIGRMSQQHGAERSPGLSVGMALRVVNSLEPRLHDVVAITKVNEVVSEIVALACTEQRQGVSVEGALLDLVQLPDISRVNRCDEMDPPGLIEG